MSPEIDEKYMRMALSMARRGLGMVAPNPAVGCVLVKDDVVIAAAHTARGGRPHAEAIALEKAGYEAKGACAYVSLEPCSHTGQTGPCAQALIDVGVVRVVVACEDPDPRVSGRGIAMLNDAGVEVVEGVLEEEALALNQGFISRVIQRRPFVTLKCAVSTDGKIAAGAGERTQISGELSQRYMHLQRSLYDAILVGSETYLVDKPKLTTRLAGFEHESLRVILDRRGRIKDASGFEICRQNTIEEVLAYLAEKGITRLLVEGGAQVHRSFLEAGLVDEFQLCKSPLILGDRGVDAADFGAYSWLKLQKTRVLGEDMLEIYIRED
ncbi:MAG TPA: bifunctional diaminohydroxyphosphoribosylaminopyrimidine deaminase/5-amino-6-(5-phosphoribosylamino)uracil reductase RibD [Alphaproteobacteria bacterium]|nr:bifunctional diaminohydroxyphosphoribosylaminopyrimidine deaminase/5-amino-6-(5-phosphoribosylamino)uracil reductase RibD [Alphaproteobacteria bacterium]USO06058.1 MAG: bifunctional diaminohydroxyphosphoribosylaminopyrimidine deaminase/5-amino-6-(5-phosphoribosylamino)uracil reductase RibD [Rhodospirillales bacterium]HOO81368.1 bifunctional diaminohydroxyphosphoribosylaminopyrimidine deaminase/5-amino-6-(5-phosphoribosylamino)uracil reductase RibD [Alphaproteobacteria bacterium]